jgi:hypothetical protein
MSPSTVAVVIILIVLAAIVVATLLARRRDYKIPGEIIVRCMEGHLFMTIWISLEPPSRPSAPAGSGCSAARWAIT